MCNCGRKSEELPRRNGCVFDSVEAANKMTESAAVEERLGPRRLAGLPVVFGLWGNFSCKNPWRETPERELL